MPHDLYSHGAMGSDVHIEDWKHLWKHFWKGWKHNFIINLFGLEASNQDFILLEAQKEHHFQLVTLFQRPRFEQQILKWTSRDVRNGLISDIYERRVWKTFLFSRS